MNRTMITATNTLTQLQKQLDIISNNMANVDTVGYKRKEGTFTDLIYQQFDNQRRLAAEVNRFTPNGIRQGTGAKLAQVQIDMAQGSIKPTDRVLDTAFTKEGQLYKVLVQNETGSNVQYTRNGALYITPVADNELALVNSDGHAILDENENPIYIEGEPTDYSISSNGQLSVKFADGTEQIFDFAVVQVNKPQFLESAGNNLYRVPANLDQLGVELEDVLTDLVGPLRTEIAIQQGALEQSNVNMAKEMTELIQVQRAYQFQSRSVTIADQMLGLVNSIR